VGELEIAREVGLVEDARNVARARAPASGPLRDRFGLGSAARAVRAARLATMSDSPARRWILSAVVAAVLVVAAIVAARAIRDDDQSSDASARSATSSSTSTIAASTTVPTTTAAPTTTTAPGPTASTASTSSPTSPDGPPGPCGRDTAAIRAAVGAATGSGTPGPDLASCRLAASDPSWAAAQVGTTTVVLHRDAATWAAVAQGGTDAGCGQAPQQVIVDLGQFCIGTGGGAAS
jgi:hypothetical protein